MLDESTVHKTVNCVLPCLYLFQNQPAWALDIMGSRSRDSSSQKLLEDSLAAKELQIMEKHLSGKRYAQDVKKNALAECDKKRLPE